MTKNRYDYLMKHDEEKLTPEEITEGWHFCFEWDGLLVGPDMPAELGPCHCWPDDHIVYKGLKR